MNKNDVLIEETEDLIYKTYPGEDLLSPIIEMISDQLSEPYPIYTYRYFLNEWPDCAIICYSKKENDKFIGCIVGNCENKKIKLKGYIAMLAVDKGYRKQGIGKKLVQLIMKTFINDYQVNEIALETETDNIAALSLYESLGFIRTKKYLNYYLNGSPAYKLKLFNRELAQEQLSN